MGSWSLLSFAFVGHVGAAIDCRCGTPRSPNVNTTTNAPKSTAHTRMTNFSFELTMGHLLRHYLTHALMGLAAVMPGRNRGVKFYSPKSAEASEDGVEERNKMHVCATFVSVAQRLGGCIEVCDHAVLVENRDF